MKEIIRKMMVDNPDKVLNIICNMKDYYGEEILDFFNCHIKDEDEYNKYVAYLQNYDNSTGGHWNLNTINQKARIDYDEKDYTMYDFAYMVNMIYSDIGDLMSVDNIFIDAQRKLESDPDYTGDPSERAYYSAKEKEKYFSK